MLKIIGAGLAGLVAANVLRHRSPVVLEASPTLPNNHRAVLRFASPRVGDAVGIPFRRVTMVKTALPYLNPVADVLAYAKKVSGVYSTGRSIATRSAEVGERWIAPPDLVQRLAERVEVRLNSEFEFPSGHAKVISTVPMPDLMRALDYAEPPEFYWRDGWVVRTVVAGCDAFATVLVPDPRVPYYRASITGDELIVEGVREPEGDEGEWLESACHNLGISHNHVDDVVVERQAYAKITPIDENARKQFIFWASTVTGRAFSLGRFATWRPGLLADDLIQDVRLIDGWIDAPAWRMDDHEMRKRMAS